MDERKFKLNRAEALKKVQKIVNFYVLLNSRIFSGLVTMENLHLWDSSAIFLQGKNLSKTYDFQFFKDEHRSNSELFVL